jgi:hypothetical protein
MGGVVWEGLTDSEDQREDWDEDDGGQQRDDVPG